MGQASTVLPGDFLTRTGTHKPSEANRRPMRISNSVAGRVRVLICALAILPASATTVQAQDTQTTESPVRYDTDLLSPEFHKGRRAAVLEQLPDDAVAVVFGAPTRNRDNDVDYEYRQSSDLLYLTGTTEPGTALILAPAGIEVDGETVREVLFVPPRNAQMEVWIGRRFGPERAAASLGVEKAVSNDRFGDVFEAIATRPDVRYFHLAIPSGTESGTTLGQMVKAYETVARPLKIEASGGMAARVVEYMMSVDNDESFGRLKGFMHRIDPDDFGSPLMKEAHGVFMGADTIEQWLVWRRDHVDNVYADGGTLRRILTELRMVKTAEELALMQKAIDITTAAHREAIKSIEPGMYEYEVEALIEYVFRRNGSEYPGFPSIVGSGENSTILHYESNRRRMEAGDMVVMDIGAEYHGYSADVTRTVPVNGTFSEEQRKIYELVLAAQEAGIAATRAGNGFADPHRAAMEVVTKGLIEYGLITDPGDVRRFFNHGTSHYLGLSVHDVGTGGPLVPGTVITVEPGVYIRPAEDVDPKWWNTGVRIEDDILVTEGDPVNMSAAAPRTVAEIELLMSQTGVGNEAIGAASTR